VPETTGWMVRVKKEGHSVSVHDGRTFTNRKEALAYLLKESMEIDFESARFVRLY